MASNKFNPIGRARQALQNFVSQPQKEPGFLAKAAGSAVTEYLKPYKSYGKLIAAPLAQLGGIAASSVGGFDPTPDFIQRPAGRLGQQLSQTALNLRQQTGTTGSVQQGIRPTLRTAASGISKTGAAMANVYGTAKLPANLLATGVGSVIGGTINKLGGGSFAEGAGRAIGATPRVLALSSVITEPGMRFISRGNLSQLSPTAQQAVTRAASGFLNTLEDEVYSRLDNISPTLRDRVLAFGLGAILTPSTNRAAKERLFEGLTPQQRQEAQSVIRDASGRYREVMSGRFVSRIRSAADRIDPIVRTMDIDPKTGKRIEMKLSEYVQNPENIPIGLQAKPKGGSEAILDAEAKKRRLLTSPLQEPLSREIGPQTGLNQNLLKETELSAQTTREAQLPTSAQTAAISSGSQGLDKSLPYIIPEKGKLNVEKLNLDRGSKEFIRKLQGDIPVTVIGNKEVVSAADLSTGGKRAPTDEQMKNILAKQLATRQEVVSATRRYEDLLRQNASPEQLQQAIAEIADKSRIAQQEGTLAGRLLQARKILANELATPMQKVFALLDNAGVDPKLYTREAAGVDWNNAREVIDFYRKFVPPKFGEILDEVRYTNMLSSPVTHIVNTFSNFLQAGIVKPIEKIISGVLDAPISKINKRERQYYASQGLDYAAGFWSSLPQATKNFKNVVSGETLTFRPDMQHIPTGTSGPLRTYTAPLRLLEGADMFFRTMVEGGETKALKRLNLKPEEIAKRAAESSEYTLFRQAFDPNGELGQGYVLRAWDHWNKAVSNIRRLPGGKWILPFVQTPTNILKQGLEYSPLGFSTVAGSKRPIEQLSKAVLGSAVFSGIYSMLNTVPFTWETPSGEKERAMFYAAGMQPYSVKIGDKWVSYSKLGPLSYPIAMAAALRNIENTDPDKATLDKIGMAIGDMSTFFADQSYVKNFGDLLDAFKSNSYNKFSKSVESQVANLANQLVPYGSFLAWIQRTIDPYYRKPENVVERVTSRLPLLSQTVDTYYDYQGNPSRRSLRGLNAISPVKVSRAKEQEERAFKFTSTARRSLSELNKLPPEEANQIYARIRQTNPQLANQILKLKQDEQLQVTDADRKLRSAGVANGERARAIEREISKLKTNEEKRALWNSYVQKGIITEEVAKQLYAILQK